MKDIITHLGLGNYEIVKNNVGKSGSGVYRIKKKDEVLYLKVGDKKLQNLSSILDFLEKHIIHAPKLLNHGIHNGKYYVLMSECKGLMAYELEPLLAVTVLAKQLKLIHSLEYTDNVLLKDVYYYKKELSRIDQNRLSDIQKKFIKNIDKSKIQNDLVFTHGDYCLPNILFDGKQTSIIDLDYASISFRYSDILDCIWSLEFNFGTNMYTQRFLHEYGISELDEEIVEDVKMIHRILEIKGY